MSMKEVNIGDIGTRGAQADQEFDGDRMTINMGPSHPATHGVLRLRIEVDGETVTSCDPVVGYLHRGDEKIAENMTYNQFIPYTDRLDYIGPVHNNVTFALAVEKLAGLEVPPRCQAIRVLCCEIARLQSHLLGCGVYGMDCGALTVFMYAFNIREKLYTLLEQLTGARFTNSYTRIGGLSRDIPEGWLGNVLNVMNELEPAITEISNLLSRNRIFWDRTVDVGVISREDAIGYGLTGPNLRASGVSMDLRKDNPYLGYENYEFDVPIGSAGDCYDRWLVRIEEMRESVKIIRQAIDKMPDGPWYAEDAKDIFAPRKDKILTSMEELIQNFMIVTEGPKIPAGEVYFEAENPKGALGFFIVSKGGGVPYRMKIRSPSFCNLSILPKMVPGHIIPDVPILLGSLDFVLGECDR